MANSVKTATFEELWAAWPQDGNSDFVKACGGDVPAALKGKADDSAARLSAAYNKTGHALQKSTLHSGVEVVDSQGFKYMTSANELASFLRNKLGNPRHMANMSHALGRKGIVLFEGIKSRTVEEGSHFELWDGKTTVSPTGDYWSDAATVSIWELPHEKTAADRR